MSDNGHQQGTKPSTVRALDKLELQVKALTLHANDIVLISFSTQPSVEEVLDLQKNLVHLMSHMALPVQVHWVLVPPGVTFEHVDATRLEETGWFRKSDDVLPGFTR